MGSGGRAQGVANRNLQGGGRDLQRGFCLILHYLPQTHLVEVTHDGGHTWFRSHMVEVTHG